MIDEKLLNLQLGLLKKRKPEEIEQKKDLEFLYVLNDNGNRLNRLAIFLLSWDSWLGHRWNYINRKKSYYWFL